MLLRGQSTERGFCLEGESVAVFAHKGGERLEYVGRDERNTNNARSANDAQDRSLDVALSPALLCRLFYLSHILKYTPWRLYKDIGVSQKGFPLRLGLPLQNKKVGRFLEAAV